MNNWKTIITYLVNWDATSIKTVEFSNRLIKWIYVPRKDFKDAIKREELNNSWIYLLLWEDEEWNLLAYLWQATILWKRLNDHYKDSNKDFWNIAIAFTYKDWTLNESDINFLERELIKEAKNAWRYVIKNGNWWNNGLIQEYRIPDMIEFIDDLKILLESLGFKLFKELVSKEELKNEDNVYYLTARWTKWKVIFTNEWFIVLKWSRWPKSLVDSMIKNKWYAYRKRPKLLEKWIIKEEWDEIVFIKDYVFNSPSWVSDFLTWRSTNWWLLLKNKDWKTLDEIERKS